VPSIFTTYSLEVDVQLIWYPLSFDAGLKEPRMRIYTSSFSNKDFKPDPYPHVGVTLDLLDTKVPLLPNPDVLGGIDIKVTQDGVFDVGVQLEVGLRRPSQRFLIPANTRVPFMLNASAADNDKFSRDTAAVFKGVFTATPLPSFLREVTTVVRSELRSVLGP